MSRVYTILYRLSFNVLCLVGFFSPLQSFLSPAATAMKMVTMPNEDSKLIGEYDNFILTVAVRPDNTQSHSGTS